MSRRPLMKVVGVLSMCKDLASASDLSTSASVALVSMHRPSCSESMSRLGPFKHLVFQVLGRYFGLMFVDPIVIFPKRGGALPKGATARHGGRLGPGMNRLQRRIFEVHTHLSGKPGDHVIADYLGFLLAIRALEIAEDDHHDGCSSGA